MKRIIIITGPTGCGKTELAIKIAKKFNGEIIGADSRQIYKGMKIGTAAPRIEATKRHNNAAKRQNTTPANSPLHNIFQVPENERVAGVNWRSDGAKLASTPCLYKGIQHYLIGFLEPDQIFSVAEFKEMATKIARDIICRGKIPIICGGTAFYLHALSENLAIPKVPPNWKLRKKLEKKDLKILIKQLKKLDPAAPKIVDLENKRRIIRALEVLVEAKKRHNNAAERQNITPINSSLQKKNVFRVPEKPLFNTLQIGIKVPRHELYKRIDARVEEMIKQGLVGETKCLIDYFKKKIAVQKLEISDRKQKIENGKNQFSVSAFHNQFPISIKLISKIPALSGIGYKEILDYMNGKTTLEEAGQKIKFRTHKYVRGQMNWFRRNRNIKWVKNYKEAAGEIKKFLKDY